MKSYDLLSENIKVFKNIDLYIGINESVINESELLDKIKETINRMIEKVKKFIEKIKVFIMEKYSKIIISNRDHEYNQDKLFNPKIKDWKDFEVETCPIIIDNYSNYTFELFDGIYDKFVQSLLKTDYAFGSAKDIDDFINNGFEEGKKEIDNLKSNFMKDFEHFSDKEVIRFNSNNRIEALEIIVNKISKANNYTKK